MKVDTMRQVDYYAGVPLCFIFTLLFKLVGLLRPWRRTVPQRVLFVELSEMGSAIIADPAMRKMRATGAELYFVIFSKNAPSLRLLGTVPQENIFLIDESGLLPLALSSLRFLLWTRRHQIDTVIDLELFSRYSALLTGLSGANNRIGFHAFHNEGLYRGDLLSHKVAYNAHLHIAKNFIALINAALAEQAELPYSKTLIGDEEIRLAQLSFSEEQLEPLRARVREAFAAYDPEKYRIVLINPNASELLIQRRWMPERYAELMRRILERYEDVLVLITGAPAEREEAEELKAEVGHERCVNFAGRVKFAELPPLYAISTLMVSNDSGPGHFSAVTAMPSYVIFGPETPALYGSLGDSTPIYAGLACSPCVSAANHRKTPCYDNVCLQVIAVEQVFATIRPRLDG
ncbi:MAG: glycosyltransferase family 9 protein [Gammaproteobacteria bacterium]|nr:glycosyltransferase family 9 protein [Gammaproteobacteria bacterium]